MTLQAQILCVILVVGLFAYCGCASTIPPLHDVYEIVQDFPEVTVGSRSFKTNWWIDTGNVRKVTLNGPINDSETAQDLCKSLKKFVNQKDWLVGVSLNCHHHESNNTVTLELSGQPDPTYNPSAKLTSSGPLKHLKIIAERCKDNTQVLGVQCRSHWMEDKCGSLHVMIECPIDSQTDAKQFCHKMINYFNHKKGKGKGSLRDSTTHCNRRDTSIEAEFIGNTKKEENCVAPRHYQYEGLTSSLVEFKH